MDLKQPPPPPGNGCAEIVAMHKSGVHWNLFTLPYKGVTVHVQISPCSWMYGGYGTQVRLALKENSVNAEAIFFNDKSKPAQDLSREDILAQARDIAAAWLEKNGTKPIEKAQAEWAKLGPKLRAAVEKEQEREKKRQAKEDAGMKRAGYTHRTVAWIHPRSGDDYQAYIFTKGLPTAADLVKLKKDSGSNTPHKSFEL
jgi:hypothetical protein